MFDVTVYGRRNWHSLLFSEQALWRGQSKRCTGTICQWSILFWSACVIVSDSDFMQCLLPLCFCSISVAIREWVFVFLLCVLYPNGTIDGIVIPFLACACLTVALTSISMLLCLAITRLTVTRSAVAGRTQHVFTVLVVRPAICGNFRARTGTSLKPRVLVAGTGHLGWFLDGQFPAVSSYATKQEAYTTIALIVLVFVLAAYASRYQRLLPFCVRISGESVYFSTVFAQYNHLCSYSYSLIFVNVLGQLRAIVAS